MASINASTSSGGGIITTADATGNLNIQSGGSTVVAVTSAGATVTGTLAATGAVSGTTGTFTGVSTFPAGTALLPAITTTGDTNTGMWFPAADTIAASTGGTERMRIDSSGRVTMPYQPAFRAYTSVTQSSSIAPVPFNTAIINRGSYYNTSTYRFTAPVAGMYFFHLTQSFSGCSSADIGCSIRKNGTTVYNSNPYLYTVSRLIVDSSALIELAISDYVDIAFTQYAGGGSLESSALYGSQFEGYLIG